MSDATHPPSRETPGNGRLIDFPGGGRGASRLPENNLPLELTSFVGREREMAEIEGLLLDDTRLLTLTGPGGSGKTRLALAVAADLMESFEDGVWWVDLAPISDPDLVPQAVAQALMIRDESGQPLVETLVRDLASTELLLVLDNCEHLIEECAALADTLLRSCPEVRILATSREALGIAGENAWQVPSLSLPDPEHPPDLEGLAGYEAIGLFIERAKAAAPTFELKEHNAPAVARLCRRLDGMPLAIELAAARVRVLSLEQIASRLEDSFGLLKTESHTALPRQRTLRATIEWSHDLLSEKEKLLFRRLSVFAGGFTLRAAEEACAGDGIERDEMLDLLTQLVDKSLVSVAEQDGEARYRLLETVRQYGLEKLEEGGEAERVRGRHAQHYLALAEEAEPKLKGPEQETWLERLETEHDNLRAALGWALERGENDLALQLGGALGEFWHMRGHLSEGRRWLQAALANGGEASEPARAKALARAGWIAWEQGEHERSVALSEESLALSRKMEDQASAALALLTLGLAQVRMGELERASTSIEEAVALQRASGDMADLARSLLGLGFIAILQRDFERAAALHEESLALAREAGDAYAINISMMHGAFVYLARGELQRARALCEEGLALAWRLRMMHSAAHHLNVSAALAGAGGQPVRSARLWGAAETLREAIGGALSPVERSWYGSYNAAALAELGETAWDEARAEGKAMTPEEAVQYALGEVQEPLVPPTQQPTPSPPVTGPTPQAQKAAAHLRIFALGGAQVEVGGRTLGPSEFGYAKPQELLFYLLCNPPRTREQIGLALWPEASTSKLRGSFHEALRRLRKALGEAQWIVHENKRYSFNRSLEGHYFFFDVEAFEERLAEARRVKEESSSEAISHLKEAVGLYGGDFLEGFAAEGEWAQVRQEELRRSYQDALQDLGVLLYTERRYSEAAEAYRKVIALDRYSEAAYRELMRSEAALGERGRALEHYRGLVELLQKELGSSPAPETVALYEDILRGEGV